MKNLFGILKQRYFNRETFMYIVVGGLTTVVDYAVFAVCNILLKTGGMPVEKSSAIATATAWFFSVIFAFFANKLMVFESRSFELRLVLREGISFFSARILSGFLVVNAMWIWVSVLGLNEYIGKIVTDIINVILNYTASKYLIFRKKRQ